MKARGVPIVAIPNLEQSRAADSRHSSGIRLYELADVVVDTCAPIGGALLPLPGLSSRTGASSTVAGAAVINSIIVEVISNLLRRGKSVPVLPSPNIEGATEESLSAILSCYRGRIKYLDLDGQR